MSNELSEAKAKALRKSVKPKCDKCKARDAASSSPLSALISKLQGTGCPCQGEGPRTAVVVQPDAQGRKPLEEKPVQEEKKHKTSPFTLRCVAAITGGKPSGKEELSGAFAKCNATKNKSDHNLDASAKKREGFKSRKAEFVKALNTVKNKRKKSG